MADQKGELSWRNPTTNKDGSPFDESQFSGWLIDVDGSPGVSIPIGWKADNTYVFSLLTLHLSEGPHNIAMQTVGKNGRTSDPSATAVFTQPERTPNPPLAVTVV